MSGCTCCCVATVAQSEMGIVEVCGKFDRVVGPGWLCLRPCFDSVAVRISLRLLAEEFTMQSKTKDNVMLDVTVSVQYAVIRGKVELGYYAIADSRELIETYVQQCVRAQIAQYDVDQVFLLRSEISHAATAAIGERLGAFGFRVTAVLVQDLELPAKTRAAMNAVRVSEFEKTAAIEQGEGAKLSIVKAAEAEAEAKRLSGQGLAEQRRAIVAGLQTSIETFRQGIPGLGSEDVLSLLLLNQYFDTLRDVARHSKRVSLFLPHTGNLRVAAAQFQLGVLAKKSE